MKRCGSTWFERSQILGSDPLGLVVLFTRGLAGWMQSWWEAPAEPSTALGAGTVAGLSSHAPVASSN